MKKCSCCNEIKPKTEFYKKKDTTCGLTPSCKICTLSRNKKWRDTNSEKVASINKTWAKNNRDKCRKATDKYQQNNLEKFKANAKKRYQERFEEIANIKKEYNKRNFYKLSAKQKEWRNKNKTRVRISQKEWRKKNPEKQANANHVRRCRKLNNGGSFKPTDIFNIMIIQGSKCKYCKSDLILHGVGKYHIDHRIPLSLGGSNNPDNLQLLCPKCNLAKSSKHPDEYEQSIDFTSSL